MTGRILNCPGQTENKINRERQRLLEPHNNRTTNLRDQRRGFHDTATWSKLLDRAGSVQRPCSPERKKKCRSVTGALRQRRRTERTDGRTEESSGHIWKDILHNSVGG